MKNFQYHSMKKYNERMIIEAVDIAVGDQGYKSDQVIQILRHFNPTSHLVDENGMFVTEPQALDDYYLSLQE